MAAADSSFRSKHAGKPGSLVAIRVDYPLSSNAFDPLAKGSELKQRHEQIDKFIRGPRIGDKADWNASSIGPMTLFPDRAIMRQNSEFQGVKLAYNYRAATLPTTNHDTTFVPKPNKMQVDRSLFLSPKEKSKLVDTCPGTAASLSRAEIGHGPVPGADRETSWNVSTQLDEERANIFKEVKYASLTGKNKSKSILNQDTYIAPHERVANLAASIRSEKLSQRSTAVGGGLGGTSRSSDGGNATRPGEGGGRSLGGGGPAVFKMSNMAEWWNRCPLDLPVAMTDESAIDKESEGGP